jgi:hypothetical protein
VLVIVVGHVFRIIHGGNGLFDGPVNDENLKKNQKNLRKNNFLHVDEKNSVEKVTRRSTKFSIPREQYLVRYGPTTGDRVERFFFFSSSSS